MNNKMKSFLREGARQYADALATVAAFEQQMSELLETAVQNRKQWHPLKGPRISKTQINRKNGESGYWIAIFIEGKSPRGEKAKIDCGLWWCLRGINKPIVYASYYDKPKRVLKFAWRDQRNGIQSHVLDEERTILYLPLKDPTTISFSLKRLLDAILGQLTA
jgi:hypothetical protein